MAAKRGKSQARRSGGGGGGGGGLPGWAWLVVGVAVTLLVVLAVPRMMGPNKEGFFRPKPNPDALPKPATEDAVVDEEAETPPRPAAAAGEGPAPKKQAFDFYTLLPGKEVPMTDAELAASERAEQSRETPSADAPNAAPPATGDARPLPAPIDEPSPRAASTDAAGAARPATPVPPTATPTPAAPAAADTRYILQAGAFQASGQAEELKAKIALLGLGARVESAEIGGKTVYRVRMGPYGTASELAEAKRKLGSGGLSAMAVRTQ